MKNSISYKNFEEFFKKATGYEPYPYQTRLAGRQTPDMINIPTGAGKTEAAVLCTWLWHKINDDSEPTRLIYCLPMRVLVEQTAERIKKWLENLGLNSRIDVIVLMGGSEHEEFKKYPSKECVVIGTQDVLISGALNRAYGNSPYSWPIFFGLLNNDCMWVMDEVQIMDNALPTSIQIDAFRDHFKTYGQHKTTWMSATINQEWFMTVDHQRNDLDEFRLEKNDTDGSLKRRNNAIKTLQKADIILKKQYSKEDVKYLYKLHVKGTLTAIMVNTVKRAQELYDLFVKENVECKLIHSRFRKSDRDELNKWIINTNDCEGKDEVIISTQVLEAGVDISVRTLISEIAPWSNMVQRFGRCNRRGTMKHANVYWIDITEDKMLAPYDVDSIKYAKEQLDKMDNKSVSPNNMPATSEQKIFESILRKKDLVDLFDTSADLYGNYTDVSRFVRTIEQSVGVNVFWRDGSDSQSSPQENELCKVRIEELKSFLKGKNIPGHTWDYSNGVWKKVWSQDLFPGQTIMLDSKYGGYSSIRGWDKNHKDKVDGIKIQPVTNDSNNTDPQSLAKNPVTLEDHTIHVMSEMRHILGSIKFIDDDTREAILTATKYHDIGKIHPVFQGTMQRGINGNSKDKKWAKSVKMMKHEISGFRHEVASTLAYIANAQNNKLQDLIAYLIISHHGKVRMSMRGVYRKKSTKEQTGYLLGIKIDGDTLPGFSSKRIPITIKETEINMELADMGRSSAGPSWAERVITLRDKYGPFRLSYMEALIRAADGLASKKEDEGGYSDG